MTPAAFAGTAGLTPCNSDMCYHRPPLLCRVTRPPVCRGPTPTILQRPMLLLPEQLSPLRTALSSSSKRPVDLKLTPSLRSVGLAAVLSTRLAPFHSSPVTRLVLSSSSEKRTVAPSPTSASFVTKTTNRGLMNSVSSTIRRE